MSCYQYCVVTQAYSYDSVTCVTIFFLHMVKVLGRLSHACSLQQRRLFYADMLCSAYDLVTSSSMVNNHCKSIMCFMSFLMTVLIILLFTSLSLDCDIFGIPDWDCELDVALPGRFCTFGNCGGIAVFVLIM